MVTNQPAVTTGDDELDSLLTKWLFWDKNETTLREVNELLFRKNVNQLRACMMGRVSFGTAGMRAEMGAGFNRLNDLTIIQTTQGMVRYLQKVCPSLKANGIVVGYDNRHNSQRFAHLVATAFLRSGVKVYLFSKIVPTPFVSYAVTKYKCDAGVMITASHNPKHDNGYKAYWSNGAQLLPPHDFSICQEVLNNFEPWVGAWDTSIINDSPLRVDCQEDIFSKYITDALKFCHYREINEKTSLKLTFTAFHGVGYFYTPALIERFGFHKNNIVFVKEQIMPDPDFPTVHFPNPEEGASVLSLSFKTADENNSSLILANDPDADRFQMAEKRPDGSWRVFTGNEMGGLLAWWQWHCWQQANPTETGAKVYMINSAVSSRIVNSIAKKEGFNYLETLTGFKWMGNKTQELRQLGNTVLLSWEESIGYMPGETLDKDGVLTSAIFAEFAAYLRSKGNTFESHLNFIGLRYGYHLCCNSYFISHDPNVTKKIFERVRRFDADSYPKKCGSYPIKYVRDLTVGYDNSQPNNKPTLPVSATSEMITFTLENGSVFTLRASGTEPKIKYYIEVILEEGRESSEGQRLLEELKKTIINEFLQPEINHLIAKE